MILQCLTGAQSGWLPNRKHLTLICQFGFNIKGALVTSTFPAHVALPASSPLQHLLPHTGPRTRTHARTCALAHDSMIVKTPLAGVRV